MLPSPAPADAVPASPGVRPRALAHVSDAAWTRLALLGILALTATTYLWDLSANGMANTYYAAAALAAGQDWGAWFFGSFDASNFITVDKPPASLWVMGLSVRLFGMSSWSLLVPQALMGVATVGVLFATVRRSFGAAAGLLAALLLALTPVAALMFRFDNPDALLTLLLVLGAWALVRGLPDGSLRWAILAAALIGVAFLAKSLQAWLVLPGFALVWLLCAGGTLRHRVTGLVAAGVTVVLASAWWVAIVELLPASARPYIGGSETNSELELILGYNGLGRILGGDGPGGGGIPFSGTPGVLRLFNETFGGQISWLLPLAILAVPVGLWLARRDGRTSPALAGYVLWGTWLAVTGLTFSLMSGIVHEYYAVALAPAVAALTAGVLVDLWRRRSSVVWSAVLAGGVVVTAWWAAQLLARTPDAWPRLDTLVLGAGLAGAAGLVAAPLLPRPTWQGPLRALAMGLALVAVLSGPVAYTLETATSPANGSIVLAGPVNPLGEPGGGRFGGGPGSGGPNGDAPGGGLPGGGAPGRGGRGSGGPGSGGPGSNGGFPGFGGGFPGFDGPSVDDATLAYLEANRGEARWLVAISGSQGAAAIQLASRQPVMAMGGFSGGDPAPTLEQLRSLVASGDLRFVIVGGRGFRGFGPGMSRGAISTWVQEACTEVQIPGGTVSDLYDCAGAVAGA